VMCIPANVNMCWKTPVSEADVLLNLH
jgi:hypothetical protein